MGHEVKIKFEDNIENKIDVMGFFFDKNHIRTKLKDVEKANEIFEKIEPVVNIKSIIEDMIREKLE